MARLEQNTFEALEFFARKLGATSRRKALWRTKGRIPKSTKVLGAGYVHSCGGMHVVALMCAVLSYKMVPGHDRDSHEGYLGINEERQQIGQGEQQKGVS